MFELNVGDKFETKDGIIKLVYINNSELAYEKTVLNTTRINTCPRTDFSQLLENGQIKVIFDPLPPPIILRPNEQQKYDYYLPYLEEMVKRSSDGKPCTTKNAYNMIIQTVKESGLSKKMEPPSRTSLCDYFQKLRKRKCCIKELFVRKGCGGKRITDEQAHYLEKGIDKFWVKDKGESYTGAYKHYVNYCEKGRYPQVSKSTFFRKIKSLSSFDKVNKHSGLRGKNNANATNLSEIEVSHVLERVEIDRCVLDVSLFYGDQTKTTSVAIYAAIDVYSRVILALTLELDKDEDTDGVMRLLTELYAYKPDLPYSGKVRSFIKDNGSGFKARVIPHALQNLGPDLISTPVQSGESKPFIESFFNVLGQHFSSADIKIGNKQYLRVPGYRGVVKTKGQIKCSKKAQDRTEITVEAFKAIIGKFVLDYNRQWKHSKLGMTPHEKWMQGVKDYPPVPVNFKQIRHNLHYEEVIRTLSPKGEIRIDNQVYCSHESKEIQRKLKLFGQSENPKVRVRYNPHDAGSITIYAESSKGEKLECVVEHSKWGKSERIVRFSDVKKSSRETSPLFAVCLSEEYSHKPKKKKEQKLNGTRIPSYSENREKGRDSEDIVDHSNHEYAENIFPEKKSESQLEAKNKDDSSPAKANNKKRKPSLFDEEVFF